MALSLRVEIGKALSTENKAIIIMLKYFLKILIIQSLSFMTFGQNRDTVDYNNRIEFDRFIGYSFMNSTESLTSSIREKVNTIFDKYDFSGDEFDCQYRFGLIVDLDSCGFITNCNIGQNNVDNRFGSFLSDVCSVIVNSKCQLQNAVQLSDTSYIYNSTIFIFEFDCTSDGIIFNNSADEGISTAYPVFRLKSKENVFFFDGFTTLCD